MPSSAIVLADKDYDGELKSRKCDLCADAPYHWDDAGGGPEGKQACVVVCPMGAIPTSKYQHWMGGHGMGSAIFFDLVKDKTIDGFDPANVVTMMTSPLSGTLVPAASGRTEVQGIGVQSYPTGWFTRSNLGGRFSGMLKFAGWDGIVIRGKADNPVWVDIRDGDVRIRDCAPSSLWGKDTWDCQRTLCGMMCYRGINTEIGTTRPVKKAAEQPSVRPLSPSGLPEKTGAGKPAWGVILAAGPDTKTQRVTKRHA